MGNASKEVSAAFVIGHAFEARIAALALTVPGVSLLGRYAEILPAVIKGVPILMIYNRSLGGIG
jgi:hypothetical protein